MKEIRPCKGVPVFEGMIVTELGAEVDSSFRSGLPEVSSPPTGKYPRHALPPRDMGISSLVPRS